MKKLISKTLVMLAAAAVVALIPATVKAEGMPCTEATLKGFLEYQTACEQELAKAQADKAACDANVAALKAQGVTGLDLQVATDAAFNAGNAVMMYQHKLNGAKANVEAITGRGKVEQYHLDMEGKWKERGLIDNTQTSYDSAKQLAAGALEQLNVLKTALVNQQANAIANPALAANAQAMEAQVAQAEANYQALKANADALYAQLEQQKATLNWATNSDNAQYADFVVNYGKGNGKNVYSYDKDGNPILQYTKYGEGQMDWDNKVITYDVTKAPNEWSIRWFE